VDVIDVAVELMIVIAPESLPPPLPEPPTDVIDEVVELMIVIAPEDPA
jgi:hypothetical protein